MNGTIWLEATRDAVVQELSKASLWAKAAADRAALSKRPDEVTGLLRVAAKLDERIAQITKGA